MLAEANVPPNQSMQYFGEEGDRLQMMLNFWVNQRIFYTLATGDARPLRKALLDTYRRPDASQWGVFLRAHDELDLGRLTKRQRERCFEAFGPEPHMRLYERGIRRRLAPMLQNDRRRIELANSLLLTLPGTPVIRYGDEIGMGDNLDLPERYSVRTPMQWSAQRHGGFTTGRRPIRPLIDDPVFGYKQVNVSDQRRDPNSLLNWTERVIRTRKECAEIGWGDWHLLPRLPDHVLGIQYDWDDRRTLVLHNFTDRPATVRVRPDDLPPCALINMLSQDRSEPDGRGRHTIELEPYGYRWLRLGDTERPLTDGHPRRR
jgi:maltose alpha-D-glucosyltransferase/alpha-amylase